MTKRPGTWSDDKRATVGERHRTAPRGVPIVAPRRLVTPAPGVPIDELDFDKPITGVLSGEELDAARLARAEEDPTGRILLLEASTKVLQGEQKEQRTDHKELAKIVGETRDHVHAVKLDVVDIRSDQKIAGQALERIEGSLKQKDTDERADRTFRRQLILKAAGGGAGAVAAIVAALHWLARLF